MRNEFCCERKSFKNHARKLQPHAVRTRRTAQHRHTAGVAPGRWGASLPLRAHHEGAPAQTIPRMQRRARVLRAREPNADPPCWHAREPALNNWAPPRKSAGEKSLTSDGRRDAEGPRRAPQPSGDARDRAGCAECTSGVARRPRAREGTAAMPRRRLRALLASLGGGIKDGEFQCKVPR